MHEQPTGLCQCGCGQPAPIASKTNRKRGWIKGKPVRYVDHHFANAQRGTHAGYVVEDRGYETSCWIWQGGTQGDGYGRRSAPGPDGKRMNVPAHRAYFEEAGGVVPAGMHLDHLCLTPLCVNPAHLEPVTVAENRRRSRQTLLTRDEVVEIKRVLRDALAANDDRLPDGLLGELGARYGVAKGTIRSIRKGGSWRDV